MYVAAGFGCELRRAGQRPLPVLRAALFDLGLILRRLRLGCLTKQEKCFEKADFL